MNGNVVRINVSLRSELVHDLKRLTPARGLSKFLSEAAEEKIAKERREKAFRAKYNPTWEVDQIRHLGIFIPKIKVGRGELLQFGDFSPPLNLLSQVLEPLQ